MRNQTAFSLFIFYAFLLKKDFCHKLPAAGVFITESANSAKNNL